MKYNIWVIFIILVGISSCKKEDSEIIEISIKTPPLKVEYYINELLDLGGMSVNLKFDNGSIKEVSYSEFSTNGISTNPENAALITPYTKEVEIFESTFNNKAKIDINLISLIDQENNNYKLVKIGEQIWMAENLRTTKLNDGTDISLILSSSIWDTLSTPAFCWYNNDKDKNKQTYGALYNWYVVNSNKLAPKGWHVPTHAELAELIKFLSSNQDAGNEGFILKSKQGWNDDGNGSDIYWFGAQPGGYRIPNGSEEGFNNSIGNSGHWWSSTEHFSLTDAQYLSLYDFSNEAILYHLYKKNGISVRCIKD